MYTILVVDDDEPNRHFLCTGLAVDGNRVLEAANGAEALVALHGNPVDLIVSDVLMPVMDGYSLCLACKRNRKWQQIPFVLLTAMYTDPQDVELGLRLGAARVIVRPVAPDALKQMLYAALEPHAPVHPLPPPTELLEDLTCNRLYSEVLVHKLEAKVLELERANQALRANENALQRSQEVAHVGHWTWDTRTNTVSWSQEMFRIFGVDPLKFDGNLDAVIQRAIHPADVDRVLAANHAVIEDRNAAPAEYRVVWPDGSVHHLWAVPGDRVTDAQGKILQLSGIVQDITVRKLSEEKLRDSLQRLSVSTKAAGLGIWEFDFRAKTTAFR
ncbi:MAG: response regulator [Anaerolineales bacterium]|nr:response regulator [Anaerolineales bacterium]